MLKQVIAAVSLTVFLMSCDVRTKDKVDDMPATQETKMDAAAPPTTVQLIDSVYNFGKVSEGEVVEFSYRFKNNGNTPLVVTNVSASCGCTVPEKPEAPVMPGETGFIKVKFNSDGRPGATHKTVTVLSNATPAFPELLLTGEVLAKNKS